MEPFRYHVFICDQKKPEGVPCCPARGSAATIEALRKEVARAACWTTVQITLCGSLGVCERGPNLVVYPEGVWYSGVRSGRRSRTRRVAFCAGPAMVGRLVNRDEAGLRAEIQSNRAKFMAAQRAKDASGVLPDDLNQTLRAYMESRALLTALELDVFTAVGSGATAAEVAQKISTHPRATEMLLNALVSMGMLAKQEGVFRDTPVTARYFAEGSKDNARPGLIHTGQSLAPLVEPDGLRPRRHGGGPPGNGGARRGLDQAVHRRHASQCGGARAAGGAGRRPGGRRAPAGCGRRFGGVLHRLRQGQ
jgi:DNA-binding CsgD family transcriptional regulator